MNFSFNTLQVHIIGYHDFLGQQIIQYDSTLWRSPFVLSNHKWIGSTTSSHRDICVHSGLRISDAELHWPWCLLDGLHSFRMWGPKKRCSLRISHILLDALPSDHVFFSFYLPTFLLSPSFHFLHLPSYWLLDILSLFKFWKIWSAHKNKAWKWRRKENVEKV